MIGNIIWDVDGTLFDTYPAITRAFQAALKDLGYEAPYEWVAKLAQISITHCLATLAAQYHLDENEIGQRLNAYYDLVKPEDQPPFAGAAAICEYICSMGGKNVIVTHRRLVGTTELLEAHDMTRFFAGWITRDDGYARKPDPEAFEAAIARYDLKREETITIGDREIDIGAGQAAGLFSCLFGAQESAEQGSVAELRFQDFADLHAFLLQENGEAG
jgi:phosphoglycolate phosphatase-like HAD superfamily hydrolase